MKKFFVVVILSLLTVLLLVFIGAIKKSPEEISYGVSFSKFHADELRLPWKETYQAILTDLNVKHIRLSAHWPMVESENDRYNFEELDYQIEEAEKHGVEIILSVGRRLPGWPECHESQWAKNLSWEERKGEIREYIETVVNRYKDNGAIVYWQVENEPFLTVFAREHCGGDLDKEFLEEEIALVRELDPSRQIIVTDSGNLGLWFGAWKRGDVFGTSVYLYLWNPTIGKVKTVYHPFFYKLKTSAMELFFGKKESFLIELSLEPFLTKPIVETSREIQLDRMGIEKWSEVIEFAGETGFKNQYLWGAEWWYYMKLNGHPEFWNAAKDLF